MARSCATPAPPGKPCYHAFAAIAPQPPRIGCMRPSPYLLPRWLPIVLLVPLSVAAVAGERHGYRLDPVHTRVLVEIDHAGYSTALGTLSGSTGAIAFDPHDWRSARVDVRVPLRQLSFGDEEWTRAAQRMLGAASWPEARFISDRVEPGDARNARVCGTLYLHGARQPLCLDVRFNQSRREPLPPFQDKAGFSANARLDRTAFGIDDWKTLVGRDVGLRIEVEAVRDDSVLPTLEAGAP
jgi:polyisoprenoid-binding protein YceI